MKLTSIQQKELIENLSRITETTPSCVVCKKNTWNVSDTIFELREFNQGNLILGGTSKIYPVIPMTCSSCSNTIFINPIILGVLEQQNPAVQVEEGDPGEPAK